MTTPNLAHWSSNGTAHLSKGQAGCWSSPVHQTVTKGFQPPKLKLGDKLGSLSQDIFERMSTASEDVSLALTLTSLHADRDDLPKNLPKTTGQESKTSTSVWRVSFKNVFVLSSLSYLIPTRSWSVRVVGQALILSAQIIEPHFLGWPCVHGWLWDSRRHSTLWPEGWVIGEALHLPSYGLVLRQRQWRHCSHSNTVSSGAQRDQPNMDAKRYGNGLDLRKNVAAECWHAVASSKYIVAWPLPYPVVKISSTTLPVQIWLEKKD